MQDRRARSIGGVNVVHDHDERRFLGGCSHRLEKRVGQPEGREFRGRGSRFGHTRVSLQDLGRESRKLREGLRVRPCKCALHDELPDELRDDRKRQLPLRVICLHAGDHRSFHLTTRGERVAQRRLANPRITQHHNDPRIAAPHVEPRIVQRAEFALATDEHLRLEAAVRRDRRLTWLRRVGDRAAAISQQVCHPHQVGTGLGAEFFGEQRFVTAEDLQGVRAVADPGPGLHEAAHRFLGRRVEIVQQLRVALDRREVGDAAGGVHVTGQRVTDFGDQLGGPLTLPVVEGARAWDVKAIEEPAADCTVRPGSEMSDVRLNGPSPQADRCGAHEEVFAPQLGPQHRNGLRQRMTGAFGWRVGPQQVGQRVAREHVARLQGEPDQQREVLARAEAD